MFILRFAICSHQTTANDVLYSWKQIQLVASQILNSATFLATDIKRFSHKTIAENNSTKKNDLLQHPKLDTQKPTDELCLLKSKTNQKLSDAFLSILEASGEDTSRCGLIKTPTRAAKAFEFFTSGYKFDLNG